jgi:transposase-like protein
MTSTPNRKRKNITFEEKYEIIKDKQKGISVKELIEKYGQ